MRGRFIEALRGVFPTAPELIPTKKGKPVAKGVLLVGGDKPDAEHLPVTFGKKIAQDATAITPGEQVIVVGRLHFDTTTDTDGRLQLVNTRMKARLLHKNLPPFLS